MYDFDKYFDIPEGKENNQFEGYAPNGFDPDNTSYGPYLVNKIESISEKKSRIYFSFRGAHCENRGGAWLRMKITTVGSIVCDNIISLENEPVTDDNVIFTISKKPWSKRKVIQIQNTNVGKVTIVCSKLYAERLDYHTGYDDEEKTYD